MSIEIVENERQQYVMIPHNVTINSGLFILKILDTEKRSFCHETKDPESKSHLFMVVYIHETLSMYFSVKVARLRIFPFFTRTHRN